MPRASSRALTERVALDLLQSDGIAAVWQLHLTATTAYRIGNRRAAEALIELADVAERLWSGCEADSAPH